MAKNKTVAPSPQGDGDPVPLKVPEVDGGGEHLVYVERHDGLIPYLAKTSKRRQIVIGGITHEHCSEHDGCWVYRAS